MRVELFVVTFELLAFMRRAFGGVRFWQETLGATLPARIAGVGPIASFLPLLAIVPAWARLSVLKPARWAVVALVAAWRSLIALE